MNPSAIFGASAPAVAPAPLLHIAVVGHTNAGKTSLLRTLTRRRDFGEVSARPGATRHTETVDLVLQGQARIEFWDTPGLEDAVGLEDELQQMLPESEPIDRLRAFLASPLSAADFEQEAKVVRALLGELDAAMLVIDCREPVLPKYKAELRLLVACAKPVFPVLNHVAAQHAKAEEWLQVLRENGLHAHALFDAVAPFAGAEQTLYSDLASLLPKQRTALQQVRELLSQEATLREMAACQIAAQSLLDLAQKHEMVALDVLKQEDKKQQLIQDFRAEVMQSLRAPQERMLAVYGFDGHDVRMADMHELAGDWANDLFDPEMLRQVGLKLGRGAAIGGAVGLVADVAMAGLSLGTGTTVGAALGGIASRGWQPALELLRNRIQGQHALRLEDEALLLLAQRWLTYIRALNQRSHANPHQQVVNEQGPTPVVSDSAAVLLQPLRAASLWSGGEPASSDETLVKQLSAALYTQLQLPLTLRLP